MKRLCPKCKVRMTWSKSCMVCYKRNSIGGGVGRLRRYRRKKDESK